MRYVDHGSTLARLGGHLQSISAHFDDAKNVNFGQKHDVKPTAHTHGPIEMHGSRRHGSQHRLKTWLFRTRAGGVAIAISKFCIVSFLTSLDQHQIEIANLQFAPPCAPHAAHCTANAVFQ